MDLHENRVPPPMYKNAPFFKISPTVSSKTFYFCQRDKRKLSIQYSSTLADRGSSLFLF